MIGYLIYISCPVLPIDPPEANLEIHVWDIENSRKSPSVGLAVFRELNVVVE
jgi:hypothetical protein